MRSDSDRLDDIPDAITKINERVAGGVEVFARDEMLQVWVIHHLQIIGEAARGISQTTKVHYPGVPWAQMNALRNILVHEYFGLNMHQVWMVTQKELPAPDRQLRLIRAQINQVWSDPARANA